MTTLSMRALLTGSVAAAALLLGGAAQAANYEFGEVSLSLDSTVSLGTGLRAGGQDCTHISRNNGGCSAEAGFDWGGNEDDGNVNYEQWDFYSAAAKITSDFQVKWRNYGAFVRATAFYDYIGNEEAGTNTTRFGRRPLEDQYRGDDARNAAGRDLELLDAFVYGNFEMAGQYVSLRAGQQVVNWGESLFIRGGINSYLPVNVAATRTPGSEVREALLPVPALYANMSLPANFSLEAVWFLDWKDTKFDPVGTLFATNDFFGPGGVYQISGGVADDPDQFIFDPVNGALGGANAMGRTADWEPDNKQGQYGAKLGYYADWLNNGTDLGLYFVNYHSNLPILSFTAPILSNYLAQYPEDIKMYGASFNTNIPVFGGTALAGEVAYSPNTPFQINTDELNALTHPALSGFATIATFEEDGRTVRGYVREDVVTGQLQTTSQFSTSEPITQMLAADNFTFLANVGFQYLPSVSDDVLQFLNSSKASSSHPNPFVHGGLNNADRQANIHADTFSWGYRLVAMTDYNNAFDTAWTITPSVQFGHDVQGHSAGPIGPGFIEDTKSVTLGVAGSFQSAWRAQVQYTNFFGNSTYNPMSDKDFIAASVSYAF